MYIPSSYKIDDSHEIHQFIRSHNFGTLISTIESNFFATHLPFLLHEGSDHTHLSLSGHMAKANPQWKELEGQEVLVIFQGPHAYVASSWYPRENVRFPEVVVPTWNYTAVHFYGTFHVIHDQDERIRQMEEQICFYESTSYLLDDHRIYEHLFKAITNFRIESTRIEAKYKIGQKEPELTRQGIMEMLHQTGQCGDKEMAEFMEKFYAKKEAKV